jgi:ATP-dependent DNA helicase RecG
MARRKYKNSERHTSTSERSFQEYFLNTTAPQTSRSELIRLIRGGEDTYLELKVKLSNSERITQAIVALANTAGGVMVFGVNDQLRVEGVDNPESVQEELVRICREDVFPPLIPLIDCISFDNGRRVVSLEIQGKRRPYRTRDGRYYLRFGAEKREVTREELSGWLEEIRPTYFENVTIQQSNENDIDDALLWSFARHFEEDFELKIDYNTANFLKKDLLLGVGNSDEFVPTIAAILLFGKNERVNQLVTRSSVTVIRYSGDTIESQIVEKKELKGNLLSLFESSLRFIKLYTDLRDEKIWSNPNNGNPSIQARANYNYQVVSEAVVNALIHRDLALREPQTKISIFASFIEISNPRRTNGFVPPASRAIRYGITQRINPQIASIFSHEAYVTDYSNIGLPTMLHLARRFSGKRAEIYTSNDEFRLKIYGK